MSLARTGKPSGFLGGHHTAEARLHNSIAHIGLPNGRLGKHPSQESRRRMSLAHLGKTLSPGARAKIAEFNRTKRVYVTRPHTPAEKEKVRETSREFWSSPEGRETAARRAEKLSTTLLRFAQTPEGKMAYAERGQKAGEKLRAFYVTPEGRSMAERSGKRLGEVSRKNWANPEWRTYMIQRQCDGMGASPNYPESVMYSLLEELCPGTFEFVGDTAAFPGWRPDFVDWVGRRVIEVYGNYWHQRAENRARDANREANYRKMGFCLLVVWESELCRYGRVLNDITPLARRISEMLKQEAA